MPTVVCSMALITAVSAMWRLTIRNIQLYIYLKTLKELGITASEAIVFEDSPNGVTAARTAGIYVVAVPNPTTSLMNLEGADLKIKSLASLPLQDLISRVAR